MSTATDEDLIVIDHLDFEFEEVCDFGQGHETTPNCEKPAEWVASLACCGRVLLWCDEHFWYEQKMLNENDVFDMSPPIGCGKRCKKLINAHKLDKRI